MTKIWASAALFALYGTCVEVRAFVPAPRGAQKCLLSSNTQCADSGSHQRRVRPLHAADGETPENHDDKNAHQDDDNSEILYNGMDFDKAVKVAKAQAKVEKILNGPDPPFDFESEMKKVTSISPGLAPEEQRLEDKVAEMESSLYAAIERQDYESAASKKEEIGKAHVDDCGAVLQVNSAFYKAFSDKDFEAMEKLWLKDNSVLCIHPSHAPLVGNKVVLASWKSMFESTDGSFQRNWMEPSQIRLVVKGATAIVTCDEEVYARLFIRGKKRQTELINKLTATNIFRKVSGKWFMVHHHASWHCDSDAAKNALKVSSSDSVGSKLADRRDRRVGESSDADTIRPDGILGLPRFGPMLGGSEAGDGKSKRIFKGTLSDLLSGGLNDILGKSDGQDDAGGEDNSPTIIHFTSLPQEDDADDENEDGADDDDGESSMSIVKKWGNALDGTSGSTSPKQQKPTSQGNSGNVPKDALRQNCISALRKLCDQGSISPKQKRVLLTDIITCSAKGEFSMVEVAYELLCGEGEDKDVAEEEFADQCRVFALSLPDSPSAHQ